MKRFLTSATKSAASSEDSAIIGSKVEAAGADSAVEELMVASLDNTMAAEGPPDVPAGTAKAARVEPESDLPRAQADICASAPAPEPTPQPGVTAAVAANTSVPFAAPAGRRKKQKCNKAGGGSTAAAPASVRLPIPVVATSGGAAGATAGVAVASAHEGSLGNRTSPNSKAQTASNKDDPIVAATPVAIATTATATDNDSLNSGADRVVVEEKAEVAQKETFLPSDSSSNSGKSGWASLLSGQQAPKKPNACASAKGSKGRKPSLSSSKQDTKDSNVANVTTTTKPADSKATELPATEVTIVIEDSNAAGLNVVEIVDLSTGSDNSGSCVSSSISTSGDNAASTDPTNATTTTNAITTSVSTGSASSSSGSSSSSSSSKNEATKLDLDDDAALLRANLFFLTAPQRARRKGLEAAAREKVRVEERKQEQRRVTELLNANKRKLAAAQSSDGNSGGGGVSFFAETAARIAEAKKAASSATSGDSEGNGDGTGQHGSAKGGKRAMWPEVPFPKCNHVVGGAPAARTTSAAHDKESGATEKTAQAVTATATSVASASGEEEPASVAAATSVANTALVLLPRPLPTLIANSRRGATASAVPEVSLLRGRYGATSGGADPIEVLVAAAARCGVPKADALTALEALSAAAYNRAQAYSQASGLGIASGAAGAAGGLGGSTEGAGTVTNSAVALKPVIDVDALSSCDGSSNVLDLSRESLLKACPLPWCDLYRPTKVEEFRCRNGPLPHTSAATRLAVPQVMTWLREWKAAHGHTLAAALSSSSANQKSKNAFWLGSSGSGRGGGGRNGDEYSDGDSDDEDSGPGNACLLHGPPGVGKTATVYALAEQLGFHVIEVHAGQARNGAAIQNLLFEATQSRHVDFSAAHARDFYANQAVAAVTESTITATTGVASSLFGGGKAKAGKGNSAADNSKPPAKKKPTSDAAMKKAEAAAAAAEAAAAAKALKEKEKAAAKAKAVAKSHAKLTLILFEEVDAAWALEQASAQEKANHAYNHDANNGGINANGSGSSSSNSGSGSGGGGGAVARGRVAADDDTAANGVDLGFFASLKMLIRSSKCPIVLTANSVPQAKDFERLKCRVVPLAPPPLNEVTMQLCTVGAAQKLSLPGGLATYDALAREAHGDLRASLHTLMLWVDHTTAANAASDVLSPAATGDASQSEGEEAEPESSLPESPILDDDENIDLATVRWGHEAYILEQAGYFSTSNKQAVGGTENSQMDEDGVEKSAVPASSTVAAAATILPWSKLLAPPRVTHVVPFIGPLEGGGLITVHGEGFTSRRDVLDKWLLSHEIKEDEIDGGSADHNIGGAGDNKQMASSAPHLVVLVGGQPCSDVTLLNGGKLKCIVPHGMAAGACEVEVIVDGALKPHRSGSSSSNSSSHASSSGGASGVLPVYWYLKPGTEEYDEAVGGGSSSSSSDDDDDNSDGDDEKNAVAATGKGLRRKGRPPKGGTKGREPVVVSPADSDDFVSPTPVVEEKSETGSRLKKKKGSKANTTGAAATETNSASGQKASLSDSDDDFESPLKESNEKAKDIEPSVTSHGSEATATATETSATAEADWVQCDSCSKWRVLPPANEHYELPEGAWYCHMNTWNPKLASCDAPEEDIGGGKAQSSQSHGSTEETTSTVVPTSPSPTPEPSSSNEPPANCEAQQGQPDHASSSAGGTVVLPASRLWPPPARFAAFRGTCTIGGGKDDASLSTAPKGTTATLATPAASAVAALRSALTCAQFQADLMLPLVAAAENASFVDCALTSGAQARDCDGRDVAVLPRAVRNGGGASAFGNGDGSLHGQGSSDPWWGGAAQGRYGELLGPAGLEGSPTRRTYSTSTSTSTTSHSCSSESSSSGTRSSGFDGVAGEWGIPLVRRDFPQPGADPCGGVAALNTYGSLNTSGSGSSASASGGASLLGASSSSSISGSGGHSGSGGAAGPAGAAGDGDPAWFPTSGTLASLPVFAALLAEVALRQSVATATGAAASNALAANSPFSLGSVATAAAAADVPPVAEEKSGNRKRKASSSAATTRNEKGVRNSAATTPSNRNGAESAHSTSGDTATTAVAAANSSDDGEFHDSSEENNDNEESSPSGGEKTAGAGASAGLSVGSEASSAAAVPAKQRPWGPTRNDERQFVALHRSRAAVHASLAGALVPHQGTGLGGGSAVKARKLGALGSRVPSAHSGNDQRLGAAVACSITDARFGLATAGIGSNRGSSSGALLPSSLCLDQLPYLRNLAVIDAAQRAQHMRGEDSSGRPLGRRQRRRHLPYLEAAGVGTGGGEEQRVLEASAFHFPHYS